MTRNEHIANLGFHLDTTDDPGRIAALLAASGLTELDTALPDPWAASEYLLAGTTAGGVAACIGWNRGDHIAVLHSLAVAPPSRGSGIGASMVAEAMSALVDQGPIERIYLSTASARSFFHAFGFEALDQADLPQPVTLHPAFANRSADSSAMVRRYRPVTRGLDHRAFRLVHNTTPDATLPPGSVFFFRQSGSIIESTYRGGSIRRGHLIGAIQGNSLNFLWQHAIDTGELLRGDGHIFVDELSDGRRELREKLSGHTDNPGELLLREV